MAGETRENENRRDDRLESDFLRGADRDNELYHERSSDREESRRRSNELFDARMAERNRLGTAHEDRDGLRFRDAAIHSTAVGSLEAEVSAVGDALQEGVEDDEAE